MGHAIGSSDRAYSQGDHICSVYETREEQLAVAARFIADGLRRDERCLYATDSRAAFPEFQEALNREGVDAEAAVNNGSLVLLTKYEAHLQDGRFDSERMLAMLNAEVETSLNLGFRGLRTCGDMSWLLDDAPGTGQVVEYEALLHQFFASVRALGMCQYDSSRLPAGLLDHALDTHPSVIIDRAHRANPYFGTGTGQSGPTPQQKLSVLRTSTA